MATTKTMRKTRTTTSTSDAVVEKLADAPIVEPVVEKKTVEKKQKKTYAQNDGIMCTSITTGTLHMIGIKTGIVYTWADYGDITEVEYADLVAAIRSSKAQVYLPNFVIDDDDIIDSYPMLKKLYENLNVVKELPEVFNLDIDKMKNVIMNLPDGAKESIKSMAAKMIQNHTLNNVLIIKTLDEIFETQLMLLT